MNKDSESPQSADVAGYAFGPFVLDPVRRLVWRDGQLVPLTARIFDILWYLIEHRDRLVTKDELLERIWDGTVVEEGTLVRQVSNLRKALHERPDQHEFLVTIPGRGYRFVAKVEPVQRLPEVNGHAAHHVEVVESVTPAAPLPVPASPTPQARRTSRGPILVALGAAATIVGGVLWSLDGTAASDPMPRLTQVTFGPGLQQEPTWAPDGQAIAYSSDQVGSFDIWIQWLNESTPVRLTTSESQDWQPEWSPDGKWIVFRSERDGGGLYVVGAQGGVERRIADFGYRPRWSPDGAKVLFSESARFSGESPHLYVVDWPDGQPVPVAQEVAARFRSVHAAWHPSGQRVSVFGRARDGSEFLSVPLDGSAITTAPAGQVADRLSEAGVTFGRFAWARSGREIFFEGSTDNVRNLWRVSVDPQSLAWLGAAKKVTTGAGQDGHLALSPDGMRLAFAAKSTQTRLWSFPFNTVAGTLAGEGKPITLGGDHDLSPDAPAAGDKLLYRTVRGSRGELRELSLVDGRDHAVTPEAGETPMRIRYSPDGRRVAYVRERQEPVNGRSRGHLVISAVAGGQKEEVKLTDVSFSPTDWSRDGNWLAGTCRTGNARELAACLIPVTGVPDAPRVPRVVTGKPKFNLYQERFSPDLRWLTFMAEPMTGAGTVGIYVVSLSGSGDWMPVVEDRAFNDKPRWAPNGRAIYYLSDRGGFLNLWGRRFDPASGQATGEPFRVTTFDSPRRMIPKDLIGQVEVAIAADRLVLPLTEAVGKVWILDGLND